MLWWAVRLLWPFTETKFVCATIPFHQMAKVSYVATHKDKLKSLYSVWGLVLWADSCILWSALWEEDAAESHVMNIYISWPWLRCVKFCPGSQRLQQPPWSKGPSNRPDSNFSSWYFSVSFSLPLFAKSLSLERSGNCSDQEGSEQVKSGKILAKFGKIFSTHTPTPHPPHRPHPPGMGTWERWAGSKSLLTRILSHPAVYMLGTNDADLNFSKDLIF